MEISDRMLEASDKPTDTMFALEILNAAYQLYDKLEKQSKLLDEAVTSMEETLKKRNGWDAFTQKAMDKLLEPIEQALQSIKQKREEV